MKKVLCLICMLMALASFNSGIIVKAEVFEAECDTVFRKAMEEIVAEAAINIGTFKVKREPVYDISLTQLGFIYLMQYDDKEGFALVIHTKGSFDVTEFYLEANNPYEEYCGKNVYVGILLYLVFIDDCFVEVETGNVIATQDIENLYEKAFSSTMSNIMTGYETVYYIDKNVNKYELTKRHPAYYPTGENISNACTPAAGANILGYWTRYYPELVPGFIPGSIQLGQYLYKEWAEEADKLVENLYYAMGTNTVAPGTTVTAFISGMTSFVNNTGRQIDYASCNVGGAFNYSFAKQKLKEGMPLVLFIDGFRIDEFYDMTNQMSLSYMIAESAHAMAGFGFNETTYTLSNGTRRVDSYIQVATGLVSKPKGYYNINYNTTIDECYAITIF